MAKETKVLLKKEGVIAYKSKRNAFEIVKNGESVKTPLGESEFEEMSVFQNGIRVKNKAGKYQAFLFKSKTWFKTDFGVQEFQKLFILGDIEASVNGETLRNFNY